MNKIDKKEFFKSFLDTMTPSGNSLVGIEVEHLLIEKKTRNNAPYQIVKKLIEAIKLRLGGEFIFDHEVLIGLAFKSFSISLEPGSQFEISINPKLSIIELEAEYFTFINRIKPILHEFNLELLDQGNSPILSHKDIDIVPKPRYIAMDNYLPGRLHRVMMRETASIQVAVDYCDEQDAIEKFKVANLISPIATAMFANSPFRLGKLTSYKSYRALAWLHTDNERCGFIHKKMLKEGFNFTQMFEDIINLPMIFIERGQKVIPIKGKLNFAQFIENGFYGYTALESDLKLHMSLLFPEVRIKGYLELRNQDCLPDELKFAPVALYHGLFKNNDSLNATKELIKKISYEELYNARKNACKKGLNATYGSYAIDELAKELIIIAENNLCEDKKYLAKIKGLVESKQSPADLIINKQKTRTF